LPGHYPGFFGPPASTDRRTLASVLPRAASASPGPGPRAPGLSFSRGRTHARGIYDPVTCWKRTEDVVCLRHRWWTKGARQLNLAGHEEVIAASTLHRQLIRRHGRTAARRAFHQAGNIISEWAERGTYNRRFYDLLQHFHGTSWNVAREDPTAHASMYVPTVALTRLLADPR
jgi:hypothetical protein